MQKKAFFPVLVLCCILGSMGAAAQDTLPDFSASKRAKGKVIISWKNPYREIRQLSVQRAATSKGPFKTIITLPDPTLPENGYLDVSAPNDSLYYRLYILLDSGKYIFAKPQRPVLDTTAEKSTNTIYSPGPTTSGNLPATVPANGGAPIYIKIGNTVAGVIPENNMKRFRDSILYKTRDTLFFLTKDTVQIKPFSPKEVYRPSVYVFTNKDGNVQISLPVSKDMYALRFYEADSTELLFELKKIHSPTLTLDKSNFIRSGWFWFELYEGDKIKEKHKLYIPKDF